MFTRSEHSHYRTSQITQILSFLVCRDWWCWSCRAGLIRMGERTCARQKNIEMSTSNKFLLCLQIRGTMQSGPNMQISLHCILALQPGWIWRLLLCNGRPSFPHVFVRLTLVFKAHSAVLACISLFTTKMCAFYITADHVWECKPSRFQVSRQTLIWFQLISPWKSCFFQDSKLGWGQ